MESFLPTDNSVELITVAYFIFCGLFSGLATFTMITPADRAVMMNIWAAARATLGTGLFGYGAAAPTPWHCSSLRRAPPLGLRVFSVFGSVFRVTRDAVPGFGGGRPFGTQSKTAHLTGPDLSEIGLGKASGRLQYYIRRYPLRGPLGPPGARSAQGRG